MPLQPSLSSFVDDGKRGETLPEDQTGPTRFERAKDIIEETRSDLGGVGSGEGHGQGQGLFNKHVIDDA